MIFSVSDSGILAERNLSSTAGTVVKTFWLQVQMFYYRATEELQANILSSEHWATA